MQRFSAASFDLVFFSSIFFCYFFKTFADFNQIFQHLKYFVLFCLICCELTLKYLNLLPPPPPLPRNFIFLIFKNDAQQLLPSAQHSPPSSATAVNVSSMSWNLFLLSLKQTKCQFSAKYLWFTIFIINMAWWHAFVCDIIKKQLKYFAF